MEQRGRETDVIDSCIRIYLCKKLNT
jgi:hypothetical protein